MHLFSDIYETVSVTASLCSANDFTSDWYIRLWSKCYFTHYLNHLVKSIHMLLLYSRFLVGCPHHFAHVQEIYGALSLGALFKNSKLSRMAPPYSMDLRWRIVWLKIVEDMSAGAIASLMNISERTVRRYVAMFYQTGDIQPKEHRNGPQPLLGEFEQLILVRLLSENASIYLYEVKHELELMFGVSVSVSTICKTLRRMGFTRKAMHHIALQQSEQLRAAFMATISVYDPAMIIWVDESGCDRRNSARKYGYSLRGLPVCDHRLLCRGKRYSAIPLVSVEGILDVYLAEGSSVDGEKFERFVKESLLPVQFNAFQWNQPALHSGNGQCLNPPCATSGSSDRNSGTG